MATIETNRNQSEQLKRLEDAQERERASMFALWEEGERDGCPIFVFHNASPLPMYGVAVTLLVGGFLFRRVIGTLPPTSEVREVPDLHRQFAHFLKESATETIIDLPKIPILAPEALQSLHEERTALVDKRRTMIDTWVRELLLLNTISLYTHFSDGDRYWRRGPTGRFDRISTPGSEIDE